MKPTAPVPIDQPAPTFTSKSGTQWVIREDERPPVFVNGNQDKAGRRSHDEPAPTILFGHRSNDVRWVYERPATTVVGSFCPDVIAAPGYRTSTSRQNTEASVRVTVAEASVLQSFPADYPWQGSRSKQFEQVGNAVPPLLAMHVLSAASGLPLPSQSEVAA
jgi:DNA (cytosine-5)-methyltransferase 1